MKCVIYNLYFFAFKPCNMRKWKSHNDSLRRAIPVSNLEPTIRHVDGFKKVLESHQCIDPKWTMTVIKIIVFVQSAFVYPEKWNIPQ